MQALPYELLQLIAGSLLPRYQCRLGMTSKHHYKYLYNDLLKWHASKYSLSIPKYKYKMYKDEILSVIQANSKIAIYEYTTRIGLIVFNLTTLKMNYIDSENIFFLMESYDIAYLVKYSYSRNILNGCYRYMHYNCLTLCIYRNNPLSRLPRSIIYKIYMMLDYPSKNSMKQVNLYLDSLLPQI